MKIVKFAECNVSLPHMHNAPAMLHKEDNMVCIITAWQPSKEDIEQIKKGAPVFMQVYKEMPITMLYTVNKDGKPNI